MLLQLHGVPISSASQQPGSWVQTESRNVVGRGLRWPATQRRLQAMQPSQAGSRPQRKRCEQQPPREAFREPGSPAGEATAAGAAREQPCSASQSSTATDVDMRDANVAACAASALRTNLQSMYSA